MFFRFPFKRDAYKEYKDYLNDAWGYNHQAALQELSDIFNEPKQSNVTFPSEQLHRSSANSYAVSQAQAPLQKPTQAPQTESKPQEPPSLKPSN